MTSTPSSFVPPTLSGRSPVTGDRVKVAHGIFGKLGQVRSISPGHVIVQYDRGGRDIIDQTRRSVWIIE